MTPRKPAQKELTTIERWILGIAGTGFVGLFVFLWSLNYQLGQMQANEKARQDKVMEIQQTVSNIEEDVTDMKEKGIQDLKDRLKTLEIKNESRK